MLLSDGKFSIFVTRPYAIAVHAVMVVLQASAISERRTGSIEMRVTEADAAADAALKASETEGNTLNAVSAPGSGRGTKGIKIGSRASVEGTSACPRKAASAGPGCDPQSGTV